MGGSKGSETTVTENKVTPTAEETEFNKLRLEQQRAIQPQSIDIQKNAYNLGSLLLQGQQLPGYLQPLPQGVPNQQIPISAGQIGEDYTADLVRNSLRDIFPQFQKMGLPIESGVAQSIAGRTSGDIRRGVAEGNVNRELGVREANLNASMTTQYQNLNNLLNLLNLAVGGQAQIQSPVIATGNALGQQLAGLRSTSGYSQTTTRPTFAQNIQQVGQGIGGMMQGAGSLGSTIALCWVAKEIFGSWQHPKTIMARYYINNFAPLWFKDFYIKYGERIAKFINNKIILKITLRPLFEMFAYLGKNKYYLLIIRS